MFIVIKTQNDNIEYLELFENLKTAYGEFRRLLKETLAQEKIAKSKMPEIIKQAWLNKEYKTLKIIYKPQAENRDRKIYYNSKSYTIKEYIETVLKNKRIFSMARNKGMNTWEYLIAERYINYNGIPVRHD